MINNDIFSLYCNLVYLCISILGYVRGPTRCGATWPSTRTTTWTRSTRGSMTSPHPASYPPTTHKAMCEYPCLKNTNMFKDKSFRSNRGNCWHLVQMLTASSYVEWGHLVLRWKQSRWNNSVTLYWVKSFRTSVKIKTYEIIQLHYIKWSLLELRWK